MHTDLSGRVQKRTVQLYRPSLPKNLKGGGAVTGVLTPEKAATAVQQMYGGLFYIGEITRNSNYSKFSVTSMHSLRMESTSSESGAPLPLMSEAALA